MDAGSGPGMTQFNLRSQSRRINQTVKVPEASTTPVINGPLTLLLAMACGLIVANIYYIRALLAWSLKRWGCLPRRRACS